MIKLSIYNLLYTIDHKETSEEQLSPSKRMKTEGSNAELVVESVNKLGKTSLPKPKKRSMKANHCNIIIPVQFITMCMYIHAYLQVCESSGS